MKESLQFLYNDAHLFAVYKPAGIHSVRLPSGGGESIADALAALYPHLESVSRSPLDAGLVQRLDHETSGVLLGAKTPEAWQKLFAALTAGEITKSYVALVEGHFSSPVSFESYIGSPNRGAAKSKIYEREPLAKARALWGSTTFAPMDYKATHDASLVQASASSARRHQIRAHAAHVGYPLIGDKLYGSTRSLGSMCVSPREFFLHAWKVSFIHPFTHEPLKIESDYEQELTIALHKSDV